MLPVNEVVNIRSEPGIIIFNLKKQITFANEIAWKIFNSDSIAGHHAHSNGKFKIPAEISEIYGEIKSRLNRFARNSCPDAVYIKKIIPIQDRYFMIRAFIISDQGIRTSTHFLVLIDKLSIRSKIDLESARAHYHLSQREFEVVQLLAGGLTNKEIANQLNIAESTVKEYIHNVMRKVKVTTRSGIVARVLILSDGDLRNGGSEREVHSAPALNHA